MNRIERVLPIEKENTVISERDIKSVEIERIMAALSLWVSGRDMEDFSEIYLYERIKKNAKAPQTADTAEYIIISYISIPE